VERKNGDVHVVPISWTALVPRVDLIGPGGSTGRLSPRAALDLSRWIEARKENL
jgi:hypothetical protein